MLASKSFIKELDEYKNYKNFGLKDEKEMEQKIVELACGYQIASKYTSFSAISKIVDEETKNVKAESLTIPTQIKKNDINYYESEKPKPIFNSFNYNNNNNNNNNNNFILQPQQMQQQQKNLPPSGFNFFN
jgi:hypothetical protein